MRAGFGGLALGVVEGEARGVVRDARLRDLKGRHRAGGELGFEQFHDGGLGFLLALQQRLRFARGLQLQQAAPHAAADLPRDGRDVQPRGFGKMARLRDAMAAFARGLDRDVDAQAKNPRRADGRVVAGQEIGGGIGPFAGGDLAGSGNAPFGAGDVEVGMKVKRRERESGEIPRGQRPGGERAGEIGFEERFQAGIGQRAGVEIRRRLLRGEGPGLVMGAARAAQQARDGEQRGGEVVREFHNFGSVTDNKNSHSCAADKSQPHQQESSARCRAVRPHKASRQIILSESAAIDTGCGLTGQGMIPRSRKTEPQRFGRANSDGPQRHEAHRAAGPQPKERGCVRRGPAAAAPKHRGRRLKSDASRAANLLRLVLRAHSRAPEEILAAREDIAGL